VGAAPKPKPVVVPMRTLSEKEALAWLVGRGRIETSMTKLASDWRWGTSKVKRHLERWSSAGHIEVKPGLSGRTIITATPETAGETPAVGPVAPVSSAPGASAIPSVVSAAAFVAPVPSPPLASSDVPADGVTAEPKNPAPAAEETKPVVAATAPGAHDDSSAPANGAPDSTPVAAPEMSAREAAALPSKFDAAPEPAIVRTPVATVLPPSPPVPAVAASVSATPVQATVHLHPRGSGFVNALAYLVAVALASIAAYFSISGMIVLFPGAPEAIVIMGVVMESAKLVTVAFLAHQWRTLAWLSRLVLIILVTGLGAINAAGVYSQLVAAHFGDRVTATSAVETEAATLAAKTEVQAQTVADIDRRVAQIDAAIAEMTRRGRAAGALDAIAQQHKQREALVGQRRQEADKLAALKGDAAAVAARTHRIEIEAAPIMYVAQMMGASTEQAIRMLILLMVLTCDPLAVALTAAASRPRWRRQGA
jgi:hypothetical protein